ncbi:MAG: glycosyltransferase family 2 protein [Gelidibacter sp.]
MNVFVIIVSYNGMSWMRNCLDSCATYPIILVDNASTDESVSFIETNYPNVILIKQSKNLGFGQANNIGIRYALDHGAENVFLLNQDAYLLGSVLRELITIQKNNSEYGILSPIHITGDKRKLDKSFFNFMRKEKSGQFYSDYVLGNSVAPIYDVPFVNAAGWLLSKRSLETVGGFDPLFFHYGEDENYCQRILYHDLKIGVVPGCYIIHDRADRNKETPSLFSESYYKERETVYKTRFANILINNTVEDQLRYLKRLVLKAKLQFQFDRAIGFKKELKLLKKMIPEIIKSRSQNSVRGNHYL